ncbi:MAG: hypothetical protein WC326_13465 [Candidatus Delongbacteria bacterium]
MGVYNLYLLDETRDPKVIARLARITGLPERIVRREVLRPPFLVLREHGLSPAVAIRRDFEQLGLTLRLELVEQPMGDPRHPLSDEQAPEDGGEIVLEEGAGFRDAAAEAPPERAFPGRQPRGRTRGRTLLLPLLLLLLAGGLGAGGYFLWAGRTPAPAERVSRELEQELPGLQARMEHLLAGTDVTPASRDSLRQEMDALEARTRPVWDQLSGTLRADLEALLAGRHTLEMRRMREESAGLAGTGSVGNGLALPASGPPPASFWSDLSEEWDRRVAPAGLGEQLALERLVDQVREVRSGTDPAARSRLAALERAQPGGPERLAARALAGSLRQKGVAWTGQGEARQGWADLPDSTILDVTEESGRVHLARVVEGRLVFAELPGELRGVSVRLAALELQPKGVRRLLEAGLRLFAPEVYFATLPGSSLPRLNPAAAEAQWRMSGDPALKAALARLGQANADLHKPVLERDQPLPAGEEDLVDWLRAAAARYEEAGTWPQSLELRTPAGRFRVSGSELWHLTRG